MLRNKVVLLTGASRGLGKTLAEALLKEGCIVYSGVRNVTQAPKGTIPIKLDLSSEENIKTGANEFIAKSKKIDILIHNAGVSYYGPPDTFTLEEAHDQFQVNFFAPFQLTQLLLPLMRKEKQGRILFISSYRTVANYAYLGMYSASKSALEMIAFDWAVLLAKWNIKVSVIQPGPLNTNINLIPGTFYQKKNNPYLPYGTSPIEFQETKDACNEILRNIKANKPDFRVQTSKASREHVAKYLKDQNADLLIKDQNHII